ncbi:MAG: hypothetical protein KF693_06385 [Nitrospira sp.]|nr:hypothetical protein [Nitrospira sp.]
MKKRVKPHTAHHARVVPQSCPDCAGVLQLAEEGHQQYILYCCQIGHRYSTSSLLHSKEAQLERSLWSAAVLLKQMGDAYQQLLKEMPRAMASRKAVQRRIKEVRKQSLAIRGIIETTHVA